MTVTGQHTASELPRKQEGLNSRRMRTGIPILIATLALTVFLTSLVLETRDTNAARASITMGSLEGGGASPSERVLMGPYQPQDEVLADLQEGEAGEARLRELLIQARRFANAGNLDGAAELFQAVLAAAPENAEALHALGAIHLVRQRYEEAESFLRRTIELEPEVDYMCRLRLGVAQMHQKKYGLAVENLKIALRVKPDDGATHFTLACIYSRLAEKKHALFHLEQAYAQLGYGILAHTSDPHLDNIRETEFFQRVIHAARVKYREAAAVAASPHDTPNS